MKEDRHIVALYLARKEEAIACTADKYGRRLRSLSRGIVKDARTAEECENDTYVEAWNCIPPKEPFDYFYAFLARITRHISLNCCRNQKRLKRYAHICELSDEMEQCIPSPDNCACRIDEMALADAVNGFLGTLSEQKRGVFLRRYWYLDTVREIAAHYVMSESNVKTTLFRLREQMREYLEKEGYHL